MAVFPGRQSDDAVRGRRRRPRHLLPGRTVNADTGETKYMERGVGKGSLTYADGMLYTRRPCLRSWDVSCLRRVGGARLELATSTV